MISVYLHLTPDGFLSRAGNPDSINDTVDYGSLTKAVVQYVEDKENGFEDVVQLIDGVVERVFEAAGKNGKEVGLLRCPSSSDGGRNTSGGECNPNSSKRGQEECMRQRPHSFRRHRR